MTYTPGEITALLNAVTAAGIAVAIADMGLISTMIEANAMTKAITNATTTFPNNALIQAVFSEETLKQHMQHLSTQELGTEDVMEYTQGAIKVALGIANSKATPEEVSEYKQLIYLVADQVANAAGEGWFGTGASKVSDREADILDRLKVILEF